MTRFHALLAAAIVASTTAQASIMNQTSMPPAAIPAVQGSESHAVTDDGEGYLPPVQTFSLGVGSGVNSFGGNMGKLYESRSVVLDVRGDWAFHPTWSLRVGADLAEYAFSAAPNGSVKVSTQAVHMASQSHFLSTALSTQGFDPYFSLGGSWVSRSQNFQSFNSVEKDSAFGIIGGLGSNFLFSGGKLGLYAEASVSKIFFKDRFDQQYLESGIEDTTGALYSGRLGVKYRF